MWLKVLCTIFISFILVFATEIWRPQRNEYYHNNRQNQPQSLISDDELRDISEYLLSIDNNKVASYVMANIQGRTTSRSSKDEAPKSLIVIVNNDLYKIPTINKLMNLFNNYELHTNVSENYNNDEKFEENDFINTIITTPVMQSVKQILKDKGKLLSDNKDDFKQLLYTIWFSQYPRGGRVISSSGFEHVFTAEIKNNQISGLHNWLYFHQEENKNNANYLGYMRKIDLGNNHGVILKFHFTYYNIDKPVGSIFIGTNPEFEMALYTICFMLRANSVCPMKLNNHRFIIRTFNYKYKGKHMIGSAFPEI